MDFVHLEGTSLRVSRLSYGNMTFGAQTDEAEAERIIHRCLDSGINFLDTANIYNQGKAEEILGRILAGRRGQVVLASKVRGRMGPGPEDSGLSRAAIRRAIEGTLARLKTDYLDLYYLHQPDHDVPLEETLEEMDALVQAGKVRYAAVSNYAAWQVCQMHCLAARRGWAPVRVAQMMYNLLARGLEQEFVPFARSQGVSLVAYNPLAGGLLTGKHAPSAPLAGTRFDGNRIYLERYWHPALHAAVAQLKAVAEDAGRSLISLALCWQLHHTAVASVLLGASSIQQLDQNLAAAGQGPLPEDVIQRCDEVWREVRGPAPQYNR